MINFNVSALSVQSVQIQKAKQQQNFHMTNTIEPKTPEMPKAKVSPELAQAVYGIKPAPKGGKNKKGDESTQWVNNLPFAQEIAPEDRRNLAAVIRKQDEETDYMKKMIHLVCKNMVTPQATASLCKHGIMSDYAKQDIDTYYDKVKGQGMSLKDAFVPQYTTKEEAEKITPVGDVYRVEGQDKIYVKSDDEKSTQLKMDADTYLKLFPPVQRFSDCQGGTGDCYFLSTMNAIFENPYSRTTIYNCFEQKENDVVVQIPAGGKHVKYEDGKLPAKTNMSLYSEGSNGMKLLENAYGFQIKETKEQEYRDVVSQEMDKMNKDLAKWQNKRIQDGLAIKKQKEITTRIANWQKGLEQAEKEFADPQSKKILLTDDYGEFVIGKFGPMMDEAKNVDSDYEKPEEFYLGALGGLAEPVLEDFGYTPETYEPGRNDKVLDKILLSENPYEYIIAAGTDASDEGMESPQEVAYSIYSSHEYKVLPFDDENGNRMFKVTNPWNESHAVIMDLEKLKGFFADFSIAKVHDEQQEEKVA